MYLKQTRLLLPWFAAGVIIMQGLILYVVVNPYHRYTTRNVPGKNAYMQLYSSAAGCRCRGPTLLCQLMWHPPDVMPPCSSLVEVR
jgi:hypothetical protein